MKVVFLECLSLLLLNKAQGFATSLDRSTSKASFALASVPRSSNVELHRNHHPRRAFLSLATSAAVLLVSHQSNAATRSEAAIKAWIDAHNRQDIQALGDAMSDDFVGTFPGITMSKTEYLDSLKDIYASFPDNKWSWNRLVERKDGSVYCYLDNVTGTHSGKPYALGSLPAIEAKGTKCVNRDIYVDFTFNNGKIATSSANFKDPSKPNGPAGFYVQIGGELA